MDSLELTLRRYLPQHLNRGAPETRVVAWLGLIFGTQQMAGYILFFCLYFFSINRGLLPIISLSIAIPLLGLSIFLLFKNGPSSMSVNLANLSCLIAVCPSALIFGGGISFPGLAWLTPCLIFAALLDRKHTFFAWLMTFCLTYFALYFLTLQTQATVHQNLLATESLVHYVLAMVVTALAVLLLEVIYGKLVQQKNDLRSKLEKTLQENKNLVRILVHDIATPLWTLEMCLDLLNSESNEQQAIVERARTATKNVLSQTEHVREWMSVLDGKKEWLIGPFRDDSGRNFAS